MSICKECAAVADSNRDVFNTGGKPRRKHPKDCGCPCQHRKTVEWEDYFSSPRITEEDQ